MAYTAKVIGTTLNGGILEVRVRFTDENNNTVDESFITTGNQDDSWLSTSVARKISDLEGVQLLAQKIPLVGQIVDIPLIVQPTSPPQTQTLSTDAQVYKDKYDTLQKYKQLIAQGVIAVDNLAYLDLKTWLQTNWKDEYITLI